MSEKPIPTPAEARAAFLALRRSVAAAIEMAKDENVYYYPGIDQPRECFAEMSRALSTAIKFSFDQIRADQQAGGGRSFTVAVFNCRSKSGKNRPLAYLRDYSPDWKACLHEVRAATGEEAKRAAIREHIFNTLCDQRDPHEVIGG